MISRRAKKRLIPVRNMIFLVYLFTIGLVVFAAVIGALTVWVGLPVVERIHWLFETGFDRGSAKVKANPLLIPACILVVVFLISFPYEEAGHEVERKKKSLVEIIREIKRPVKTNNHRRGRKITDTKKAKIRQLARIVESREFRARARAANRRSSR